MQEEKVCDLRGCVFACSAENRCYDEARLETSGTQLTVQGRLLQVFKTWGNWDLHLDLSLPPWSRRDCQRTPRSKAGQALCFSSLKSKQNFF